MNAARGSACAAAAVGTGTCCEHGGAPVLLKGKRGVAELANALVVKRGEGQTCRSSWNTKRSRVTLEFRYSS